MPGPSIKPSGGKRGVPLQNSLCCPCSWVRISTYIYIYIYIRVHVCFFGMMIQTRMIETVHQMDVAEHEQDISIDLSIRVYKET